MGNPRVRGCGAIALQVAGLLAGLVSGPVTGAGAGLVVAQAGPVARSGPVPAAEAAEAEPTRVRVATANLYVRLPWRLARQDLERLLGRAEVIGLNEVGPERAAQIRRWLPSGWSLVRPTDARSPWSGSNAVLVDRTRFELLDEGVVFGSRAAMPAYRIDSRWITWVRLQERETGATLVHLQTHLDAAVERAGLPRAGAATRVRNNARYQRTVLRLVRSFAAQAEVVVGGDWNVDARADRRVGYRLFPAALLEAQQPDGRLRSTYSLLGLDVAPTSERE